MKWGHVVWQASSCIALTLLLVLAGSTPGAAAPTDGGALDGAGGIQGDADCSGSVNPVDGLVILRQDSGSAEAPCGALADVQCDGDIDPIDALQLLRFDAGLSVTQNPGCTAIGEPVGGGASSVDLINEAFAAGDISEEEALLFTTFAVFGDSRLPDEFEAAAITEDTLVLQRLSAAFDTLSTETQQSVAPFMLPPSAPESWLELSSVQRAGPDSSSAVTWQTFPAAEGKVKVWAQDRYEGDADKAEALAAQMSDTIYPLLTGLMQREPEGDEAFTNNGGDAAIDVYLVHMEAPGEMKSYGNACGAAPGYILLDSRFPLGSVTTPGILQNAAHEFFHILEWTYQLARCWYPEYRWAIEGFAKFAEDFAYPTAQAEHFSAPSLLLEPHVSLDHAQGGHAYGTYLLPYYLWREAGDASLIRQIWEAFEEDQNSIQAVGGVLGSLGGWDEVWPEIALRNWNRPPVDDYQSDGLEIGAAPEGGAIIEMSEGEEVLSGVFNHLSARYYHFRFTEDAGAVLFRRNGLSNFPHLHVTTLAKIGGQWHEAEDWTQDTQRSFCRNLPGSDIEELVVIISNSDGDQEQDLFPGAEAPIVEVSDVECNAYVGSVTAEIITVTSRFTTEASGFRFELRPDQGNQNRWRLYYLAESPAVTWHVEPAPGYNCSVSGEMNLLPADGTVGDNLVYGSGEIDVIDPQYHFAIQGSEEDATMTIACPGGIPSEQVFPGHPILFTPVHVPMTGPIIEGESHETGTFFENHYTWRFEPAP